jgi:hypothetical protein
MKMSNVQIYAVDVDQGAKDAVEYLGKKGILGNGMKHIKVNPEFYDREKLHYADVNDLCRWLEVDGTGIKKKPLTINGSGKFHYFTYFFCTKFFDKFEQPYTIVHVDKHCDGTSFNFDPSKVEPLICNYYFYPRLMADNSFVKSAIHIKHPMNLDCVNERGRRWVPYRQTSDNEEQLVEEVLKNVDKNSKLYITTDLDILSPSDVKTDYEQGDMRSKSLLKILKNLKGKREIIGADICGLKESGTCGIEEDMFVEDTKSLETHASVFSGLLDLLK